MQGAGLSDLALFRGQKTRLPVHKARDSRRFIGHFFADALSSGETADRGKPIAYLMCGSLKDSPSKISTDFQWDSHFSTDFIPVMSIISTPASLMPGNSSPPDWVARFK